MERPNISTEIFGRSGWNLIHKMSSKLTAENKSQIIDFYDTIEYVLPCIVCREDFSELYEKTKNIEYFSSREKLLEYSYFLHDQVNKKLGKKSIKFSDFNPEKIVLNWHFIHAVSFGYPEAWDNELSPKFLKFFHSIKILFPDLNITREDLELRDNLVIKLYNYHNEKGNKKIELNVFMDYYRYFVV